MPTYNNSFRTPVYQEVDIQDSDNKLLGKLRIKPSSILWKPGNTEKFHSVPLPAFTEWIMGKESKSKKVKQ